MITMFLFSPFNSNYFFIVFQAARHHQNHPWVTKRFTRTVHQILDAKKGKNTLRRCRAKKYIYNIRYINNTKYKIWQVRPQRRKIYYNLVTLLRSDGRWYVSWLIFVVLVSKFWLPVVLNSLFLEKGTEDKYFSHFPPKNRPLII